MNQTLRERINAYTFVDKLKEADLYLFYRAIESAQDAEVIIDGRPVLMFGSNNYLGLTRHPKVLAAARLALEHYGTSGAGSRLLNGNLRLHEELEEALARFLGKEAVLITSTGFLANNIAIAPLAGRHDHIIIDEQVHASIYDATRHSFGKVTKFAHNDMAALEAQLERSECTGVKFIITDGVFSMEGDMANLPCITQLADAYDAVVILDDAHGLGVLGTQGRGTAHHFGLEDKVDLLVGTFSKSLAGLGGYVASDERTIHYLKHQARAAIFSSSMTPSAAATALATLQVMQDEPEHIERLWTNKHYAKQLLQEAGFELGRSETPILPIYIRDQNKTLQLARRAVERGVFVNAVLSPAVRSTDTLIRISLMATHTFEQIERAVEVLVHHAQALEIPLHATSPA